LFETIHDAFLFVGFAAPYEHQAWIDLKTGEGYFQSDLYGDYEPLPEDIENTDRYLYVPHKSELSLGKALR